MNNRLNKLSLCQTNVTAAVQKYAVTRTHNIHTSGSNKSGAPRTEDGINIPAEICAPLASGPGSLVCCSNIIIFLAGFYIPGSAWMNPRGSFLKRADPGLVASILRYDGHKVRIATLSLLIPGMALGQIFTPGDGRNDGSAWLWPGNIQ